MDKFVLPAQLTGIVRKVDRSLSLRFITGREVDTNEFVVIDTFFQREGWLLFKENSIDATHVPIGDASLEGKKPSARLRGVLYRYWEAKGSPLDFESWYRSEMERIIIHYKGKIDEEKD